MAYKIQVSPYDDFSELVYNKIVEEVTYDVITYGLEPNTLYYWRVKSINTITGKESVWSSSCSFRTRAADVLIDQGGANDDENIIVFEPGNNVIGTCFAPTGIISEKLCPVITSGCGCSATPIETVVGGDTLGQGMCGQSCSQLL